MLEWVQALTPIFSALVGVISYATLTNYRLDNIEKILAPIQTKVNNLETRVSVLENTVNNIPTNLGGK